MLQVQDPKCKGVIFIQSKCWQFMLLCRIHLHSYNIFRGKFLVILTGFIGNNDWYSLLYSGYLHWAYHCLALLISWSLFRYFSCWKQKGIRFKCKCCPNSMYIVYLLAACPFYSLNRIIDSIIVYAFEINILTRFVNCQTPHCSV